MKIFGKKEEFAIGVALYVDKYKEDEYIKNHIEESWCGAEVCFWVKGKNLFEFESPEFYATYTGYDLYALVKFFTNFLFFQITDDTLPVTGLATNARDIVEETSLFNSDEDELDQCVKFDWNSIDMDLRRNLDSWMIRHGFIQNDGGTFLPHAYIRKIDNKIEISWHNKHPYENDSMKIYALYKKGVEYIDIKLYKNSVIDFCLFYINHIKSKYPDIANQYRKNLQKAIDVEL